MLFLYLYLLWDSTGRSTFYDFVNPYNGIKIEHLTFYILPLYIIFSFFISHNFTLYNSFV